MVHQYRNKMSNSLITTEYFSEKNQFKAIKTPVVFIHGWGLNSAVWQPIIKQLKQDIDIITIDLPGFGLNLDHGLIDYSLDKVADEIQSVIDTPAVLVGWSLGGLVATQLALLFPEKVLGCVTIASSPCFVEKKTLDDSWPGVMPHLLKRFHQQLALNTQKTLDGFLKIQAMGSSNVRHDIKTISDLVMQYPTPSVQTLNDSLNLLETVDLRDQLPTLTLPFLRLYGRLDSLVPKTAIEKIDALLPLSQKYIFTKASHAPFISHGEEFNQVLMAWLKENALNVAN